MRTLAFLQDFGQRPSLDVILRVIQTLFSFISSRSFPYPAILSKTQYLKSLSSIQLVFDELATDHFYRRLSGQSWGAANTSLEAEMGSMDRLGAVTSSSSTASRRAHVSTPYGQQFSDQEHQNTSPDSLVSLSPHLPRQLLRNDSHFSI